jgi:hypothetical protein
MLKAPLPSITEVKQPSAQSLVSTWMGDRYDSVSIAPLNIAPRQLPLADCPSLPFAPLPIAPHRLPLANCPSPIAPHQLPLADCPSPIAPM